MKVRKKLGVYALGIWVFGYANVSWSSDRPPEHTPPRLSLLEGDISFWRPSLGEWRKAPVNLPLAAGDVLASGSRSRGELQLRARVFLRFGSDTELQLVEASTESYRFNLQQGVVTLDVRSSQLQPVIELNAETVSLRPLQPGTYRLESRHGKIRVLTRKGARASIVTRDERRELGPDSELVLLSGSEQPLLARPAPPPDEWDRWNAARTESLLARGKPPYEVDEVVGLAELDRYGEWKTVPEYGTVWFPRVPRVWVPYTTGEWLWDPVYGWTWVDVTPWGWAPFHYGRWVWVSGRWAWAFGPVLPRPVYAPALVAFFVGKHTLVGFSVGAPVITWVPLAWGEPCIPWWGPAWFAGRPWWGGWHGPHHRDDRRQSTTVVNVNVNVWENFAHARHRRGIVAVPADRFGTSPVPASRLGDVDIERLALPTRDLPRRPVRPIAVDNARPGLGTRAPHADEPVPSFAGRPERAAVVRGRRDGVSRPEQSTADERNLRMTEIPPASPPAPTSMRPLRPRGEERDPAWGRFAPRFQRGDELVAPRRQPERFTVPGDSQEPAFAPRPDRPRGRLQGGEPFRAPRRLDSPPLPVLDGTVPNVSAFERPSRAARHPEERSSNRWFAPVPDRGGVLPSAPPIVQAPESVRMPRVPAAPPVRRAPELPQLGGSGTGDSGTSPSPGNRRALHFHGDRGSNGRHR